MLRAFFGQAKAGDYLCVQAYLMETPAVNTELDALRAFVQQRLHLATAAGYGPRFLHSTGQYHKGGPDTGLFLQITTDHAHDLPLPGRPYTFGTFQNAQAAGDLQALQDYHRRTLRVLNLGSGGEQAGMEKLLENLKEALAQDARNSTDSVASCLGFEALRPPQTPKQPPRQGWLFWLKYPPPPVHQRHQSNLIRENQRLKSS